MSDDESPLAALIKLIQQGTEWMDYARCKNMGPDKFFPKRGQSKRPGEAVCASCPVTLECGKYGDSFNETEGTWGGVLRTRDYVPPKGELEVIDQEVRVIPASFSATALMTYEDCPARYREESVNKAPTPNNVFAAIGTACHGALENFVKEGHHVAGYTKADEWAVLKAYYDIEYWAVFADASKYEDGVKMLKGWLARQDWTNREVISVETKENFGIQTSAGVIPFNYIMDRLDRHTHTGDIEVIDYKSLSMPMAPDALKSKLQARAYALAVQLKYPDANRIWVTFDMLRFEPIGIVFTKEENRATYKYLHALCERVIQDDGMTEILGDGCRYCIRRGVCTKLNAHIKAGGWLGETDPMAAVARLFEVRAAIKGLAAIETDMAKTILAHMQTADLLEMEAADHKVAVTVSKRRAIDPAKVLAIVGPEVMGRYAALNVTAVDEMLKTEALTPDQKTDVRLLFRNTFGEPNVKIEKKDVIDV